MPSAHHSWEGLTPDEYYVYLIPNSQSNVRQQFQTDSNSLQSSRMTRMWKVPMPSSLPPSGAGYTSPTVPKFHCEHWISILYWHPDFPCPLTILRIAQNHCARGCPPKSRISGHVNSRLLRSVSKHGQTKCLDYFMGEGWKDKLKGIEGLNDRVTGVGDEISNDAPLTLVKAN